MIDADAAYLALKARDARFDGQWFVGVTSTGVYCRPICRVRTPRPENCRFFPTAAQAEASEFRPCLKCRPELAPGRGAAWSVMDASRTLALQAADWLDGRAALGQAVGIDELARALGISDRHLRRIFLAEHGVTPLQYLQTRRLLTAKQLLTDTPLPITQVALSSGFGSLRSFNTAFARHYRMNPRQLRRHTGPTLPARPVRVALGLRPPYDTATMLGFLAQRAISGVESVLPDAAAPGVRRTLRWRHGAHTLSGWLQVRFEADRPAVSLELSPSLAPASASVIRAVRRWLDLDAVPEVIDAALGELPFPGTRLPGAVDPFEMAVRAVLGQQVTVAAARTLAARLVAAFGTDVATPWPELTRCFPQPDTLAGCSLDDLGRLGIVRQRSTAIQALAREWPQLLPLLCDGAPAQATIDALQALPGIGPWTAHYIAMRALAWPDAFPPNDIAVLNAMARLGWADNHRAAQQRAQAWRPWRAYAVVRLWASLTRPMENPR